METASAWILLHDNGNNVFKKGRTPAEAQVLTKLHQPNVKKNPIVDLKITGQAASIASPAMPEELDNNGKVVKPATPIKLRPRTGPEEIARLRTIYHKHVINEMFPGANPKVPATFEEAFQAVDAAPNAFNNDLVTEQELPALGIVKTASGKLMEPIGARDLEIGTKEPVTGKPEPEKLTPVVKK